MATSMPGRSLRNARWSRPTSPGLIRSSPRSTRPASAASDATASVRPNSAPLAGSSSRPTAAGNAPVRYAAA